MLRRNALGYAVLHDVYGYPSRWVRFLRGDCHMNIRATLVCLQVSAGQMCSRVMHQVKQQMCNGVRKLLPGSGELDEPDEPFEQYTVFVESDPSS